MFEALFIFFGTLGALFMLALALLPLADRWLSEANSDGQADDESERERLRAFQDSQSEGGS